MHTTVYQLKSLQILEKNCSKAIEHSTVRQLTIGTNTL